MAEATPPHTRAATITTVNIIDARRILSSSPLDSQAMLQQELRWWKLGALSDVNVGGIHLQGAVEAKDLPDYLIEVFLSGRGAGEVHDAVSGGADLEVRLREQVLHVVLKSLVLLG